MSTQAISTASTNNSTSPFQITGLASGLNTNAIIAAEMAVARQPVTDLTHHQSGLQALDTQLTSLQQSLQTVSLDAMNLGLPSLFVESQAVTSSNPALLTASTGSGAGVGGYEVAVTQLANSAQRTFTFASPAGADTITIDGHQETIAAGMSIGSFVSMINSDPNADVYAASTSSNTVVLSSRTTGNNGPSFIQVSDPGSALVEQAALAKQGQNAQFTVDGVSGSSTSNTVTNAIAGVTLQLGGITPTGAPVTVTVAPPAPTTSSIVSAVNQFVTDYNAAISQIETQLAQAPVSSDPTQGTLFGDFELTSLLGQMRTSLYAQGTGLPNGMASLGDLGVATDAASNPTDINAQNGMLTVDQAKLTAAIQSNPSGVETLLQTWSASFTTLVNNDAAPGGTISSRLQGNESEITRLTTRIAAMNVTLNNQQAELTLQFAQLESTLAQVQSQGSSLTAALWGSSTNPFGSSSSSSGH
jgi:flagellar hook-associated protein 2